MAIIVDRRNIKSSKNSSNRDRFIKRYKKYLKKSLDKVMDKGSIKDSTKPVSVPIDWDIKEVGIDFDSFSGEFDGVISGNDKYKKGDIILKPDEDEDNSGTGSGEETQDNFLFTLTKEEFFDIYFQDMELPDFVKISNLDTLKSQYIRSGYTKEGIPTRLDVLKTLQMSLARRISCKNKDKKPPFLDEIDLRYRNFIKIKKPMLKAVLFCLMDVSGSMEEHHKILSKKFFLLLYLFLIKNYESVDIRFIRYHHFAKETDEHEFFYSRETGGTEVLEGLNLISDIIDKEYPQHIYNIYIAQTTDGDYSNNDDLKIIHFLDNELLNKIQYFAYVQVQSPRQFSYFMNGYEKLYGVLKNSKYYNKKLNLETVVSPVDVFPVLYNLFKKR